MNFNLGKLNRIHSETYTTNQVPTDSNNNNSKRDWTTVDLLGTLAVVWDIRAGQVHTTYIDSLANHPSFRLTT